jgi:hypothetical protein
VKGALAIAIFLLAGCGQPAPPAPVAQAEIIAGECLPPAQEFDALAGGYEYRIPNGGGGGGRYIDLTWSDDPERLLRFDIRGEWQALSPLSQDLRFVAMLYPRYDFDHQPTFQGSSPLVGTVNIRDLDLWEDPVLTLGAPIDSSLPVSASATVVDQPVHITIQEVYRCAEET